MMEFIPIWGESNYSGFFVIIANETNRVFTSDFDEKAVYRPSYRRTPAHILMLLGAATVLLGIKLIFDRLVEIPGPCSVIQVFLIVMLSIYLARAITERFIDQRSMEVWRWHACEHKVIHLLVKNRKITLKNLKSENPYHCNCGTVNYSRYQAAIFISIYAIPLFFMILRYIDNILITLAILLLMTLVLHIIHEHIGPYILQRILYHIEPTDRQYAEALKVGLEAEIILNRIRRELFMYLFFMTRNEIMRKKIKYGDKPDRREPSVWEKIMRYGGRLRGTSRHIGKPDNKKSTDNHSEK